ncbi:hypothetical protein THAOC_08308 [Thalassiosira oceanica]|uniref:tRNA pseudouridine(55) synthase n=2 Tax=Thalassiosira oceanica TaxID=159749 RepID=K0SZB3_THAOC|nr:hypothetical protein THAOC_08308 [Thalassiosira oceanica]|eukprot:EJK70339.1 hypothetical protein THAOC_08308 [Thalassiosira oceanica]
MSIRSIRLCSAFRMKRSCDSHQASPNKTPRVASSTATTDTSQAAAASSSDPPPLYIAEGLFAVHKPLTWTSQDVVAYIRGLLIRDAKDRGADKAINSDRQQKRRKKPLMKVGHGGTLDPLASGVLVLGLGKGTSMLQSFLEGDKQYVASCELGYETDTLDAEGKIVREASFDHISSLEQVKEVAASKLTGKLKQVPPLYSAIRVDGKRLYEIARKDSDKAEDVEIPMRDVEVYDLKVGSELDEAVVKSGVVNGRLYREAVKAFQAEADAKKSEESLEKDESTKQLANDQGGKKKGRRRNNKRQKEQKPKLFDEQTVPTIEQSKSKLELPEFSIAVKCGGGTYIRSLVRDIGYELDTVASMTGLVRTKQGPFVLDDALTKENWTADKIYEAIRQSQDRLE